MSNSRTRSFCFTWNNYNDEAIEVLRGLYEGGQATYVLYGREVGEMGTPHLQGYIQFTNGKSLSSAVSCLRGAHVEIRRGTIAQAVAYCKKDGDFEELGSAPLSASAKGEAEQSRWDTVKTLAKRGKLDDISSDIYIRYYGTLCKIAKDNMCVVDDLEAPCGVWFWGVPGAGKSFYARKCFPNAYFKMANKWWDGYQGEENVIMDEAELSSDKQGHHLKIWTDRYAFIAEIKGGARKIRPKVVCVTSNYPIERIFGEDEQLVAALKRRFKIVHFPFEYGKTVGGRRGTVEPPSDINAFMTCMAEKENL